MTIRYDPRDLAEIRVFHRNRFLCRAICPEHAGQTVTLKDIQTARADHRRSLRGQIKERVARVVDFLPEHARCTLAAPSKAMPEIKHRPRSFLRTYREDP